MKQITIEQLHAATGLWVRKAVRRPVEVTGGGSPVAVITGTVEVRSEIFGRLRALRSRLKLPSGETVRDLAGADHDR